MPTRDSPRVRTALPGRLLLVKLLLQLDPLLRQQLLNLCSRVSG